MYPTSPAGGAPRRAALGALVAALLSVAAGGSARAGSRFALRFGGGTLELDARSDTPLLGGYLSDLATTYNQAAVAYNLSHGYATGSAQAAPVMETSQLGIHAHVFWIAPAVETGGDRFFVRAELPIGIGEGVHTVGVGLYPINLAATLARRRAVAYLSLGGRASYLGLDGAAGAVGGLVQARAALGLRVGRPHGAVAIELGWAPIALGGIVDPGAMARAGSYDPMGDAPPPRPAGALRGGDQQSAFDVSIGLTY